MTWYSNYSPGLETTWFNTGKSSSRFISSTFKLLYSCQAILHWMSPGTTFLNYHILCIPSPNPKLARQHPDLQGHSRSLLRYQALVTLNLNTESKPDLIRNFSKTVSPELSSPFLWPVLLLPRISCLPTTTTTTTTKAFAKLFES